MTNLCFVRHGQAGTRHEYDSLSEVGRKQARLLGEYFASQEIEFCAAYAGTQARQRETANEVARAVTAAGARFPDLTPDPGWNEFDLDGIYREWLRGFVPMMPCSRANMENCAHSCVQTLTCQMRMCTGDGRRAMSK